VILHLYSQKHVKVDLLPHIVYISGCIARLQDNDNANIRQKIALLCKFENWVKSVVFLKA
jgi:hypothetical protein